MHSYENSRQIRTLISAKSPLFQVTPHLQSTSLAPTHLTEMIAVWVVKLVWILECAQ
jgi:hypothetical protein